MDASHYQQQRNAIDGIKFWLRHQRTKRLNRNSGIQIRTRADGSVRRYLRMGGFGERNVVAASALANCRKAISAILTRRGALSLHPRRVAAAFHVKVRR
jgi:hypothetical protein